MSQIIRATFSPDGLAQGKTRNVARSGFRYMSDSSMRTNPSIDDPSNLIFSRSVRSKICAFVSLAPPEAVVLAMAEILDRSHFGAATSCVRAGQLFARNRRLKGGWQ